MLFLGYRIVIPSWGQSRWVIFVHVLQFGLACIICMHYDNRVRKALAVWIARMMCLVVPHYPSMLPLTACCIPGSLSDLRPTGKGLHILANVVLHFFSCFLFSQTNSTSIERNTINWRYDAIESAEWGQNVLLFHSAELSKGQVMLTGTISTVKASTRVFKLSILVRGSWFLFWDYTVTTWSG